MATYIVTTSKLAVDPPRDQDLLAGKLSGNEVAGLGQLFAARDNLPTAAEDPFQFDLSNRGIDVVARRESGRYRDVAVDQFSSRRWGGVRQLDRSHIALVGPCIDLKRCAGITHIAAPQLAEAGQPY